LDDLQKTKGETHMNETLMQAAIWLGAGGTLFIFLKRRRSRRLSK
jgi:hypothetical protein